LLLLLLLATSAVNTYPTITQNIATMEVESGNVKLVRGVWMKCASV
jgi:hypothetical protein